MNYELIRGRIGEKPFDAAIAHKLSTAFCLWTRLGRRLRGGVFQCDVALKDYLLPER